MIDPIDPIFDWIGIEGSSVLVTLILISMICQVVARLIPDNSTGWKKVVKQICSIIGLYVSNRIASGVSVNDVAKEVAKVETEKVTQEVKERVDERIEEVVEEAREVVPAFPGIQRKRDPITGEFI